jgi:hypothetical protein
MAQLVGRYAVRLIGRINRTPRQYSGVRSSCLGCGLVTRRTRTVPLDQRANPNTLR